MQIAQTGVAVTTAVIAKILDIVFDGNFEELAMWLKNNSANAWTNFEVRVLYKRGGVEHTLASIAGDYSTPLWPLRRADALVTLGAGLTGKLFLNVKGIHTLRLYAKVAVADSTADLQGYVA